MSGAKTNAARLRGLYAITPDWDNTARLVAISEQLLQAGVRLLQYRHKTASACQRLEHAGALRALTERYGAWLIINDDLDLALAVTADGVHLGAADGDLHQARLRLGADKILGASCYQNLDLAVAAKNAGADYVAFGSFFASPTKPHAQRAELPLLAAGKAATGLPVCAIGGITPRNAAPLIEAGADMLAVITALFDAPDPAAAARPFINLDAEPALT